MPRVPRPDEMPRAALEPARQPAQINVGVASRIGQSGRDMGNAIQSIGNAFGEVAGRVGQANDNMAESNARLEWLKGDQSIQDDIRAKAGEDGAEWQTAPNRYETLNNDIETRYPMSPERSQRFNQWRDLQTFNRGTAAAREYQGAQRNQFLRTFDQDVAGVEDRIGKGEVDPATFGEHYGALSGKLAAMNRTVMSEADVQAKTRELQGRLVGAFDRHLSTANPAEREAFWARVRSGQYEIDQRGGQFGSNRGGSAVDFLRSKLAPGYEKRQSDVDNLRPEKQDRVAAFLAAAEDAGHDIRIVSGHRDAQRQAVLWRNALAKYGSAEEARRHVAPPGGSTHQSGEAVDLQYQDRGAGLGGKKTAAVEWAHQNAKKFGLHFPLGHEDWHLEPVEAREGGRRYGGEYAAGKPMWKPSAGGGGAGAASLPARSAAAVKAAAESTGLDAGVLSRIAHIESNGDPTKATGSYRGLFQLSESDFRKYGGTGSINDPDQNAKAAAAKFADMSARFQSKNGRAPSAGELYLMHQQGEGGAAAHIANPGQAAWKSMASTGEGKSKGEAWAKQAIWGNLTPEAKQRFGSVDNVTSGDFVKFWTQRVGEAQPASSGAQPSSPPPVSQRGLVQYAGMTPPAGRAANDAGPSANDNPQAGASPAEGVDDNDPAGTYAAQPPPDGTQRPVMADPTSIPQGRLVPGQMFAVKTPRGEVQIPSDWINAIPERARAQMSRQAGDAFRVYERQLRAAADEMMRNQEASVAATGKNAEGYDAAAVRLAYQRDPKKLVEHSRRVRIAAETQSELADAVNLPDDEIVGRLERLRPVEGAPDFAERVKVFETAEKNALALLKRRETDPGGAVEASREVQSARSKMVGRAPQSTFDRMTLIDARMEAQRNIDVPENLRKPLPQREAESLAPALRGLTPGDSEKAVKDLRTRVQQMYGDKHSEMIVRQVITTAVRDSKRREELAGILTNLTDDETPAQTAAKQASKSTGMIQRFMDMMGPPAEQSGPTGPTIFSPDFWKSGSAPAKTFPTPEPGHVSELKSNPETWPQYEERYGPGSAEKTIPGLKRMLLMNR